MICEVCQVYTAGRLLKGVASFLSLGRCRYCTLVRVAGTGDAKPVIFVVTNVRLVSIAHEYSTLIGSLRVYPFVVRM